MINVLQHALDGLLEGGLIALAAIGISIVYAVQRFANVAQAGLMSVGAYAAYLVAATGVGLAVSVVLGVAMTAVVAVLVYLLAFRALSRGPRVTLLIASIGADLILRNVISAFYGSDIRGYQFTLPKHISLGELQIDVLGLGLFTAALLVMLLVWLVLTRTSVGRDMRAVADLPDLARLVGISQTRVHVYAWTLVGGTAAVAGIAIAMKSSLTPDLGWYALLAAFAAAILGGLGNVRGAALGGLLMGVAMAVSTIWLSPTYKPALAFAVMTVALLVRPYGLLGRSVRV
ncbi:MAG TPA: branched-chain amino acid ABC transporter permease [Mycobacteriales bacterium]